MFQGSIPPDLQRIVAEHAAAWPRDQGAWVACSGNLTVERVLAPGGFPVHGNDVNAYSCALGWYFAGEEVPFTLRNGSREQLGWLEDGLDGRAGTLATLMLGSRFLSWVGKPGRYYERQVAAYRSQWSRLHEKTRRKLEASPLRLGSFSSIDVLEYLSEVVPATAPVVCFPPFFAGDYEHMFAGIDKHFDWPQPTYPLLDSDGIHRLVELATARPHWLLAFPDAWPELDGHLRGMVQTTNRGNPVWVYSPTSPRRLVRPAQDTETISMRKITPSEELGARMRLHPLTAGQFSAIRSQFMAKSIKPGSPLLPVAVSVDGALIGAFAVNGPKFDPDEAYLLSDFPVSWSRYRRLAKLVVMAALSRETQTLIERSISKRITTIGTTAYSDNPQSAKYGRGVPGMKLVKRADVAEAGAGDGHHRYQLQYRAPLGAWSLDEALATWKSKHGSDQREPALT